MYKDGRGDAANVRHHEKVRVMRALSHREVTGETDYVEVLDYETAAFVVNSAARL